MFYQEFRMFEPHDRMKQVFVAPASRRRFFSSLQVAKAPARRRRHEKPALFGESGLIHFNGRMSREKSGSNLCPPEASAEMIVHHASGLHERVANG
jgi:hypothetical protein